MGETSDLLNPTSPDFQVSERYWAGRARLLRLVTDEATSDPCGHTIYLSPESLASPRLVTAIAGEAGLSAQIAGVVRQVGKPDTGLVSFWWDTRALVVVPPFPIERDLYSQGPNTGPLADLLNRRLLLGIVLLRLGRYAVGVLQGDALVASKSGSRYVKSRHRAGGSSQRRFERSRERLVRELFDKTCQVTTEVLTPFDDHIDYLLMGGERHTLDGFIRRCTFMQRLAPVTLRRTLEVHRPGREALEHIQHQVWRSRVLVFTRDDQG